MLRPKFLCLLTILISVHVWASSSEDYELALNAYNNKEYSEAYIYLKNSLQKDPENLSAKILMGKMLLKNTYFEEAETEFEEALELGADINLVIEPLGNSLLFLHKYDDIFNLKIKGRLTREVEFQWILIKTAANMTLKKYTAAREGYNQALQLFPNNTRALNSFASLEITLNNLTSADALVSRATAIDDKDPRVWHLKGELAKKRGDLETAQKLLEHAIKLDSEDPLIRRSLVDAYITTKNYDAAQRLIKLILEQTPDDPMALLLNSWLLSEQEQNIEASTQLEALSNKLSNISNETLLSEPTLLYISALSYYTTNNLEQASNQFSQYIVKEPGNIAAITLLAKTYIKLGQVKLALSLLEDNQTILLANLDTMVMLGELYLVNNKAFKVVELLYKLQQKYPGDPAVELLEVKTMAARGKIQQAIEKIATSKNGSSDPRFLLTRSMLHLELGQFELANKIADALLAAQSSNLDFLNLKAAILIKLKNWSDAKPLVEQVLAKQPKHYSARFNLSTIYAAEQNYQAAYTILSELSKQQANNIQVLIMLARIQTQLDDSENAILNLQKALLLNADNIQALEILSSIYQQNNQFVEAIRQLNKLTSLSPNNINYHFQKAELYLKQQDIVNFKRELRELQPLVESEPQHLFTLSNLLLRAENPEDARQAIVKAIKLSPDNLLYSLEYARLLLILKDWPKIENLLLQLNKKHPNNANIALLEGDLALAKKNTLQAAQKYSSALQLDANFTQALINFYQITLQGVATELFDKQANNLLAQNPDNALLRNLLADFYTNQHKFSLAKPHYEQLLTISDYPIKAYIYNNLANIVLESSLVEADKYIQKAMDLDKNSASILDTQGWILTKQLKYQEALTVLRRAFSIDSKDPVIRFHLALTLVGLDRKDEARSELKAALASHEAFYERLQAQQMLESM
jgi:putative PEP-CTERM system TPR-repeat lipoprotein